MKLVRLTVSKLPGIVDRLEIEPAPDRANIVIGPNASGKTSLIRALALLVSSRPDNLPVDIEAEFSDGERRILGTAIGQARDWRCDGARIERPAWPDTDRLTGYLIRGEELDRIGATEQQFSDRLRQVIAGGYDLDALSRIPPFERPGRPVKLARQFDQAERELQRLEMRYTELAGEIDQLETLREQRRESIEAQRRQQGLQRALELLGLEQKLSAARQALAGFPDAMDQLDGTEGEQLERLDGALDQNRLRLRDARRTLAEAQKTLTECGVDNIEALDAFGADLSDHRQALQALEVRKRELHQQLRDLERARETASRHAGELEPLVGEGQSEEALDELERLADRVRSAQVQIDALEHETRRRSRIEPDPDEWIALQAGIAALRDWLVGPPATSAAWTAWSLGLVGAVAASAWAWYLLERPWIAAIAAAVGLVPLSHIAGLAVRAGRTGRRRARFEATALDSPARWHRPEVEHRLQQCEVRLADLLSRRSEAERAEERRAELERARDRYSSLHRQLELAADRVRVRTEWVLETSGLLRLRGLLELREAEDRLERSRGGLADLEHRIEERTGHVRSAFEQAAQPCPDAIDGESLGHFLNRLNPRLGEARSARDAIAAATARIRELEDEAEKIDAGIRELFDSAGLADGDGNDDRNNDSNNDSNDKRNENDDCHDDSHDDCHDDCDNNRNTLRARLNLLDDWRSLHDELRGLEHARRGSLEALRGDDDLLAMARAGDEAGLVQLGGELAEIADRRDPLAERIATIENERKTALEQHELERLNAERERFRGQLEQALDAHRDAEAAQLLIERARSGYTRDHQPGLLTRAGELFGRMTQTRFALTFDGETFGARDQAMGEQRSIGELSTATRIHLLLALRLAWIDEADRDGPGLPIILDEVLATTDPARYRTVVEALQQLVRDGRQVIYLSSQPADAQAWQHFAGEPEPEIIALSPIREDGFDFELSPSIECPDPDQPAEAWARQAGIGAMDPWRGAEAIALFHLLRDRLDALNRLRGFGIVTLGQFEHARALALNLPIDDGLADLLDQRVRAVRAWLERWRRGHAPPVTRQVLEESGAVSEKFIAEVNALSRKLGGQPNALLDALRQREVSGFFQSKIDELESHLQASGFLDERREPTRAERIDTLARAGDLDADHAAMLERWLQAGLASPSEA